MNCISCKNSQLSKFLTISKAPRNVQKLLSPSELITDKKITIKLLQCNRCRLVQLSNEEYVQEDYYEDYLMSRTYSAFSQKYQKDMAKSFVKRFSLKNKNVMEVGCGDGFFASQLLKFGAKVLGVEPSSVACAFARKRGVKVIEAYVDDKLKLDGKFNAFTACQVFEHISDPAELMKNIKKFLLPDSYGLIEVPSIVKAITDNRFYDFFPDHVAYYSPTSLSYMCEMNGFDVIEISHTVNDEYLTAIIRYQPDKHGNEQATFSEYRSSYERFFKKLKGKKIVVWGAGAKGISSLSFSEINSKQVLFCVDSDPNKHGKYLPGSHIKVESPDMLIQERPDVVVVSAMMYKDEIISKLRDYGFNKSQIAVIAPSPMFIK